MNNDKHHSKLGPSFFFFLKNGLKVTEKQLFQSLLKHIIHKLISSVVCQINWRDKVVWPFLSKKEHSSWKQKNLVFFSVFGYYLEVFEKLQESFFLLLSCLNWKAFFSPKKERTVSWVFFFKLRGESLLRRRCWCQFRAFFVQFSHCLIFNSFYFTNSSDANLKNGWAFFFYYDILKVAIMVKIEKIPSSA